MTTNPVQRRIRRGDIRQACLGLSNASIKSAESILENITGDDHTTIRDNTNGGDNNDRRGSASSLSKLSNHPQQHYRTPSKVEIQDLKIIDEVWERKMALNCIRSTLEQFRVQYPIPTGDVDNDDLDYRITMLATWEKAKEGTTNDNKKQQSLFQSVLYCHVGILPQSAYMGNNSTQSSSSISQRKHIKVLIHGHGRENARAKDSKWVIDRKNLTTPGGNTGDTATTTPASSSSNESYEEIILLNDNDELLEGTQTNFYVVSENQSIITATDDILHGSVRDSVLRVCQSHGVKVELRPPTLDDLQHATGVFITSTSRLVMPVHEVVLGDLQALSMEQSTGEEGDVDGTTAATTSPLPASYCYPNCRMTENIRQWVLEDVETHSTSVYHPEG
jgi:branched-subunit amino acid aminotransferase/4-amino-4-deoxychorismate lyase